MNSIKAFFQYVALSHRELFAFFKDYKLSMLGFFLINLTSLINWESSHLAFYKYLETPLSFVVVLLNMYLIVNVLMIDKSKLLNQRRDQAFYSYPSFVIYTLYAGLVVIIIPFLIIGLDRGLGINSIFSMIFAGAFAFFMSVVVSMCPISSVLIDNDYENYFKVSLRLTRDHFGILLLYTILTLLSEAPELLFPLIESSPLKSIATIFHSAWNSYVFILVAKVGAKIFYGLYRKHDSVALTT